MIEKADVTHKKQTEQVYKRLEMMSAKYASVYSPTDLTIDQLSDA